MVPAYKEKVERSLTNPEGKQSRVNISSDLRSP